MKTLFQNREISVLSFNERVLQEAEDRRNPLMERMRFLGIFSSNMDEFFKVRVASVQRRIELGKKRYAVVMEVIGEMARQLDDRFQKAYAEITDALAETGLRIINESELDTVCPEHAPWVQNYFRTEVLPMLVPIIVDERRPFPQLTDGALYFAVRMWGSEHPYAILEIPAELSRFVELPNGYFMYLDDVIRYSLNEVFYIFNYDRSEAFEFKISRDAELDMDNDFSEGFVRKMERVLEQRKGGRPTRFVYDAAIPPGLKQLLLRALQITNDDTVIGGGRYHNMKDLMRFPSKRADLVYAKQTPAPHPQFDQAPRTNMFEQILQQDHMVTYPYQAFDHVVRLLREAAIDPKVDEIKLTLYRAAKQSQVVNALVNAARNGKNVFVSIELLARFDEMHNIHLAERLSEVGATVAFGVPPMKVHGKLFLISREGKQVAGLSTGNFNETTGKLYVDSTLFTADKRLTRDVDEVFRALDRATATREMPKPKVKHLLVSPFNTRKSLLKLLDEEMARGPEGYVLLKLNHLTDTKLIRKISEAAEAGVKMDVIVRTTYAVPPHPNIRAISILDRYLEHQRIYIFGKGEDARTYISSSDLMERNLDWRIEVAFPIFDARLQGQVRDMMDLQMADRYKARVLDEAQSNQYVGSGSDGHRAQAETYRYFQELFAASADGRELQPAVADANAMVNGQAHASPAAPTSEDAEALPR